MMNDTKRPTLARRKRRRLALAIPAAFLSMNLSSSFCPIIHNHRGISNNCKYCRRPWLALSNKNNDGEEDSRQNSDKVDSDNALLHQELKQADPEWYQEYVSDLLGEEYCKERWPDMELPFSARFIDETEDPEKPEESDDETDEKETLPEGNLETTEEISVNVDDEKETMELEEDDNETETLPEAKIETKEDDEISVDATKKSEEPDDEKETEEISASVDDEKEVEIDKKETKEDDKIETVGKSETKEENKEESTKETRAVVYRSITGKKMTCVSLSGILKLGYTVSDLETIQAEFLSIVVLDQRKCPSMGVPAQWKIKGTQKPEIQLVDSMEEASAMVKEMNEAERAEKESIEQRRRRQEDRQQKDDRETRDGRRRRRRSDDSERESKRQSTRRRRDEPKRQGGRDERRRKRPAESEPPRRRKRDRLDRNGKPRKIYRVPRDDTRSMVDKRDDPPDPESPLWVNMDTFRNLLDREAGLRMWVLGEDWSQVIEQEKDWRTDTYKNWLWMLNKGVGESIVPPSRYERARKRNQQAGPPPPSSRRRRDEPPNRRRRDEPREESPRRRRKPPPQRKQRRPKRKPQDDDEELDRVSASERRSRRRAERRRERPENEP